jgi:hypothetical protein
MSGRIHLVALSAMPGFTMDSVARFHSTEWVAQVGAHFIFRQVAFDHTMEKEANVKVNLFASNVVLVC